MSRSSVGESSVLLVAESPDASAPLAAAVRERDKGRRAQFTLLVPAVAHGLHRVVDLEDQCCAEAERIIGSHEPLAAIEDALNLGDFHEIVLATRTSHLGRGSISTWPARSRRWASR